MEVVKTVNGSLRKYGQDLRSILRKYYSKQTIRKLNLIGLLTMPIWKTSAFLMINLKGNTQIDSTKWINQNDIFEIYMAVKWLSSGRYSSIKLQLNKVYIACLPRTFLMTSAQAKRFSLIKYFTLITKCHESLNKTNNACTLFFKFHTQLLC